ncbi:MAG: hypothetical protein J6S69_04985 [Proteobacteria bacterium]|nr:hypothetical protein [Pseudomonadota bacterium]
MSKLNALLLASALTLLPASAMAEISLSDMSDLDALQSMNEFLALDFQNTSTFARGNPHHADRPRHEHPNRHHHTNFRPRRPHHVVVEHHDVVEYDYIVEDPAYGYTPDTPEFGYVYGLGLRGAGLKSYEDEDVIFWGGGWYFKYRPVRWISFEVVNDFLFTSEGDYKIPIAFGLRGHIFDYGSLDVYGVAALTTTLTDGDDGTPFDTLMGGQFGAGISIFLSAFELGVDVRYTLDANIMEGNVEHGILFSLNLGFGFNP